MKKIYSNYFQKSKVFLYPLLGIKKGIRFVPLQTYISWGTSVPESKNKLFCLYEIDKKNKKAFNIFIEQIKENIYFESFDLIKQKDDKKLWLFTFDLRVYKTDLKYFKNLLGQDAFVKCKKDGHECVVPMILENADYKEIKKQFDQRLIVF